MRSFQFNHCVFRTKAMFVSKFRPLLLWVFCILLIASVSANQADISVQVSGESCFTQPIDFSSSSSSPSFTYSIHVESEVVPEGCNAALINISPLYIKGTCIAPKPRSDDTLCADKEHEADGPSNGEGTQISVNDESAACNKAAGNDIVGVMTLQSASGVGVVVDSGYVYCGISPTGFLYIQNNCPESTGTAELMFSVAYSTLKDACYYDSIDYPYGNETSVYDVKNSTWSGYGR